MLLERAEGRTADAGLTQEDLEVAGVADRQLPAVPALEAERAVAVDPEDRRIGGLGGEPHVAAVRVFGVAAAESELVAPAHPEHHRRLLVLRKADGAIRVLDPGGGVLETLDVESSIVVDLEPLAGAGQVAVGVEVDVKHVVAIGVWLALIEHHPDARLRLGS